MKLPPNLSLDTVIEAAQRQMYDTDNPGFCLACGEEHDSCESDQRNAKCESCGEMQVFGALEILT